MGAAFSCRKRAAGGYQSNGSWQSDQPQKKSLDFQQRHFIKIAGIIAESKDREEIIAKLVSLFRRDNEYFQAQRFVDACGGFSKRDIDHVPPVPLTFEDQGFLATLRD